MQEIIITKADIRKRVLALRNELSDRERARGAAELKDCLMTHPWFQQSDTLLAFVSYGSEIDTTGIIREALSLEKKVYVPRVEGEKMNFYRISCLEELAEGYKGIREPVRGTEKFYYVSREEEKLLMLVPGAVFDRKRNRIGYGKGFYDRFLSDKSNLQLRTIGVGFQCQLLDEIPADEWDIRPGEVLCV